MSYYNTDVYRSFTINPYTTGTYVGNTTTLTINGTNGVYATSMPVIPPPPVDTPEAWLRQRVKEVCDLVAA